MNGQINCLNSPGVNGTTSLQLFDSVTIDCAGVYETNTPNGAAFFASGTNQVVKIRNLTISGTLGGWPAIKFTGSGTLIIENCAFENMSGTALDIEPNGPLNLVIKNSRISNNAAGVLIMPAAGGSVTATFNGVTIDDNTGGALNTDSTNGVINLAISNSTITKNAGNGMNVVGPSNYVIVNLNNDVIASNGTSGIQANGANAAVLVNNTSILQNLGRDGIRQRWQGVHLRQQHHCRPSRLWIHRWFAAAIEV